MPVRSALLLVGVLAFVGAAAAQNGDAGLLVSVPANLQTNDVGNIKTRVGDALGRGADRPKFVIFWFTPGDKDTTSTSYGACSDLADLIRGWGDVNTVAFVSRKLTGHAVLPALCCNELAMSSQASIGEVVPQGGNALAERMRNGYEEFIGKAKPAQFAVVRKMFDPGVVLMKGQKNNADWYYNRPEKEKIPALTATNTTPLSPEGVVGLFDRDKMGEFGFVRTKAQTVSELGRLLGLDPATLRDDPIGGRAKVAQRYVLRDAISQSVRETVTRTVKEAVRAGCNLLFLQLECDEGDAAAARDLADDLLALQKPEAGDGLKVVAFIPGNANNTAVLIALGCTEIVMSTHKNSGDGTPEGTFGDFGPYMKKTSQGAEVLGPMLADLADKQQVSAAVVRGMVEKDLVLVVVRGKKDRRRTAVLTDEEYQKQKADWDQERVLKGKGELLTLTATEARQLGLVKTVIDSTNVADVYAVYDLKPNQVKEATPAWLDWVREFLRIPAVTTILVIVGFIGLILELKVPGTTVPGIVAALCFILLFWAWAPVSQGLAWLAGLLFLLGLVLILLEVFVLPGFGVAGVIGILLMLAAIVLVTLDRIPDDTSGWLAVGGKLATYLFALIGAGVVSFLIARFLPRMPVANRMVLKSAADREAADPTVLPGAAQAAALLGAIGVASTVLRPAGTVQFGEQYVDVVSDGGFIPAGTRVQVIEVEGTRIVVREV